MTRMTDRNTISQVVESLFEDWIHKYKNVHPLAVANMKMLEADALTLLKEQNDCENCAIAIEDRQPVVRCKDCKYAHKTYDGDCKYCDMFTDDDGNPIERYRSGDWFCADGERRNDNA